MPEKNRNPTKGMGGKNRGKPSGQKNRENHEKLIAPTPDTNISCNICLDEREYCTLCSWFL